MLISILGLHLRNASISPLPLSYDNKKCLQALPSVSWGRNHLWLRTTVLRVWEAAGSAWAVGVARGQGCEHEGCDYTPASVRADSETEGAAPAVGRGLDGALEGLGVNS